MPCHPLRSTLNPGTTTGLRSTMTSWATHALTRALLRSHARLAVVVVTLLAFVSAQVQVERHEASHSHVVCADHGTVEDVGAYSGPSDGAPTHKIAAAPDPEGHQACALPLTLTSGAVALGQPPAIVGPPHAAAADARAPEGAPERTGPALYYLAPKLSPPVG